MSILREIIFPIIQSDATNLEGLQDITGTFGGEEIQNNITTNQTQPDQEGWRPPVITEGWNPFLFAIYWAALNLLPNLIGVRLTQSKEFGTKYKLIH